MLIDEITLLSAEAGCRRIVLLSAHCIDAGDHAGLAALFTPDGALHRPSGEPAQGRGAITAAYQARPPERLTRHLVVSTLVEVTAPDQASAVSRVLLWVGDDRDAPGPQGRPRRGAPLLGKFADRLRRQPDGSWLIERREASFELHG
ncbi:nuclear transport factor 2 family protein [Roseateles sp. LKC17W]|uniref:Nuclear transport factor 2 family protein n=1 Tax=Pelomonas margarita TaxID=3299031 RepID=A0ABW7FIC5_9BURK